MAVDLDFERSFYSQRQPQPSGIGTLFETMADRTLACVNDVLDGKRGPWTVTAAQSGVLLQLRERLGLARAIPLEKLARNLDCSPREIKDAVQDLRQHFGVLIGASRSTTGGGYYLIATEDELRDSTDPMLHQAVTMLRVVRAMRYSSDTAELLGQLRIELDKETV